MTDQDNATAPTTEEIIEGLEKSLGVSAGSGARAKKMGKRDRWACDYCGAELLTWRNCRRPECIALRETCP